VGRREGWFHSSLGPNICFAKRHLLSKAKKDAEAAAAKAREEEEMQKKLGKLLIVAQ